MFGRGLRCTIELREVFPPDLIFVRIGNNQTEVGRYGTGSCIHLPLRYLRVTPGLRGYFILAFRGSREAGPRSRQTDQTKKSPDVDEAGGGKLTFDKTFWKENGSTDLCSEVDLKVNSVS